MCDDEALGAAVVVVTGAVVVAAGAAVGDFTSQNEFVARTNVYSQLSSALVS